MKNHLSKSSSVLVALLLAIGFTMPSKAQERFYKPSTLNEAIQNPVVKDNKSHDIISRYQTEQARILTEDRNLNVLMTRDQEVIIVTITADRLFDPNSTDLSLEGERLLRQYASFLRANDFYRMALAMYHDDTGSDQFCKSMTDKRVQSIYDWFSLNANTKYLSYFSFGKSDPILPNNSIQNRRMNRRLEIYIIPGEMMLEQAKKKMLK